MTFDMLDRLILHSVRLFLLQRPFAIWAQPRRHPRVAVNP
jgi:hypothetical protein